MKLILALITALSLPGCITISHRFKDGTAVSLNDAGHLSVSSGKSTIDLDLPLPKKEGFAK